MSGEHNSPKDSETRFLNCRPNGQALYHLVKDWDSWKKFERHAYLVHDRSVEQGVDIATRLVITHICMRPAIAICRVPAASSRSEVPPINLRFHERSNVSFG